MKFSTYVTRKKQSSAKYVCASQSASIHSDDDKLFHPFFSSMEGKKKRQTQKWKCQWKSFSFAFSCCFEGPKKESREKICSMWLTVRGKGSWKYKKKTSRRKGKKCENVVEAGNTTWWCGILLLHFPPSSSISLRATQLLQQLSINFRWMLPDRIVLFLDDARSLAHYFPSDIIRSSGCEDISIEIELCYHSNHLLFIINELNLRPKTHFSIVSSLMMLSLLPCIIYSISFPFTFSRISILIPPAGW